jgi:hypothetical protein
MGAVGVAPLGATGRDQGALRVAPTGTSGRAQGRSYMAGSSFNAKVNRDA